MQEIPQPFEADSALSEIVTTAASLGYDIVEIAGLLDVADSRAEQQKDALGTLRENADRVARSNRDVDATIATVAENAESMVRDVDQSLENLSQNSERVETVATWVESLAGRMVAVEESLQQVQASAERISEIALQVHLLAINAKIEAARAGEAGLGFSVVADSVNGLSDQTAEAAKSIAHSVTELSSWITVLRQESGQTRSEAEHIRRASGSMATSFGQISSSTHDTRKAISQISEQFHDVARTFEAFLPQFGAMHARTSTISDTIHQIRNDSHGLIDRSERILQLGVDQGGSSSDLGFIQAAQRDAAHIGALFESAIARGEITEPELFSRQYQPIPGTDPAQVMAPFTALTDRYLPEIQEAALDLDPRVVFCAAVNRDGYLPTHNLKFSHPQGADPVENAAKSRNRRIFDDRVGLKAGQSTAPFLLQVYRRDMGGGEFRMMKDLSAPILINGRHWGGLRLAYAF